MSPRNVVYPWVRIIRRCFHVSRNRLRVINNIIRERSMNLTKIDMLIIFIILVCALTKISTLSISQNEKNTTTNLNNSIPVDLGQDKTDDAVPVYVNNELITASQIAYLNQYIPSNGEERLLKAVAALYSKRVNYELEFDKNVFISVGASGALFSTFQALTLPNDEWIIIDPFWPKYTKMIELVRGVSRFVNLKLLNTTEKIYSKDWILDRNELEKAFNNRTRGIVLNNPHNPTGKVFTPEDLRFIAYLVEKYDTYVIADEVFEWTVYGPYEFINFASLPNMFNRTISIGSASKSLVLSGWRIGWIYGPTNLISNISTVHTTMLICAPAMQQYAVAHALELELKNLGTSNSFFHNNTKNLLAKSNLITKAFEDAGMTPYIPDSGDCLVVKLPRLKNFNFDFSKNISQYEWFTDTIGVIGFPMTFFYSEEHAELGKDNMRFCFQKKFETLERAAERLQILRDYLT